MQRKMTRCGTPCRWRGSQRGFALVSVLWVVALLSLIVAGILTVTGTLRARTAFSFRHAEAKALADAAINDAILHMLDDRNERRRRVDGIPNDFAFAGRHITVSIQELRVSVRPRPHCADGNLP
jgi:general secretion pathway protein K